MDRLPSRALVLSSLMLAALLALSPQPGRAQAPSSDAAIDAARSAFEALADTDRKAIQDALIWTGDYSGVADGTFGRQTFTAIAAYQRRTQQPPNGILTLRARSALLAAAQQARSAAGFTLVEDAKTGIRIGIPTKVLPKQNMNPSGGGRWQSADDRVTLDTRSAPPDATLQTLYDRSIAAQSPGRVVSYKVLRPDFFVVAGETAGGKFYTRYNSGPEELRGFSIGYDKTVAPQFDRLVVAIANSFTPFPAQATPAPVAQNPAPAPQQAQNKPQAPIVIGTGIAIGSTQIVTTAPVASCRDVWVSGLKPRQITGRGPFVLDFADTVKAQPLKANRGNLVEGASLLVVGFVDEGGEASLVALPVQALAAGLLSGPLQPGTSGAPVLDLRGALVGLVGPVPTERRTIAGITPASSYPVVPIADLTGTVWDRLGQQGESGTQNPKMADIVRLVQPALVAISCGS
jgi:peptidoglycan hydrolase-like protein with peptidoglycan-binding domain